MARCDPAVLVARWRGAPLRFGRSWGPSPRPLGPAGRGAWQRGRRAVRANPHPWVGKPLRCRREGAAWGRGQRCRGAPGESPGVSALLPAARAPGCRQGAPPPSCSRLCEGAAALGFLCGEHVGVPCRARPCRASPGLCRCRAPCTPNARGAPCLHRAGAQPGGVPGAEAGCSHPPLFCRPPRGWGALPVVAGARLLQEANGWGCFTIPGHPQPWVAVVARPLRALLPVSSLSWRPPTSGRQLPSSPRGGRCPLSPLPAPGHLGRCAARWGLKVRGEGVIRGSARREANINSLAARSKGRRLVAARPPPAAQGLQPHSPPVALPGTGTTAAPLPVLPPRPRMAYLAVGSCVSQLYFTAD